MEDVSHRAHRSRWISGGSGETLASLARRYYGRTILWIRIWIRNQDELADPDKIRPGTTLYISPEGPLTASEIQALLEHER